MSYIDPKAIPKDQIVGRECKHVHYSEHRFNDTDDLLTIKEVIHLKDGSQVPTLSFKRNEMRPFWLTQDSPRTRNHKDKKEVEYVDKLVEYESTQRGLNQNIVMRLGYGNPKQSLNRICRNQYIYGADITSATLMKRKYQDKWPEMFKNNTVAVIDTETDMWHGDGKDIIISTVTMGSKVIITILNSWIAGVTDAENQIRTALQHHLKKYIEERKIEFEIVFMDRPGEMAELCIRRCHEWQPDFVSAWNMDFDVGVLIRALDKEGYDLADVFSDPRVPKPYRKFNYKQGPTTKKSADGSIENLPPSDRWNVVEAPASFVWIDPMCVYRNIRRALGKEPSYSLDYTLKKNLGEDFGKLYFDTGDSSASPGSVEWHMQMQKHYKVNYVVYNVFDCLGVELLDEQTTDLRTQISLLSESSEYNIFHSNPRRNINKFFFDMRDIGLIAGTCSDQMEDENDEILPGKEGWIVTLPTHNVEANGIFMIKQLPGTRSFIRRYVSDADIGSTYPTGEIIMNLSKMTTMMEVGKIAGVLDSQQRIIGVNLMAGPVNAIEIMTSAMKAPNSFDLLEAFQAELEREAEGANVPADVFEAEDDFMD